MQVQPYLFFNGRCEEAINFYKNTLGAKVIFLARFKESPDPKMIPEGFEDKVMHSTLKIGDSELMASDGCGSDKAATMNGFSMSISPSSIDEAERVFNALSENGNVTMPLQTTFWASRFGTLTDRFGVSWMVNCEQKA